MNTVLITGTEVVTGTTVYSGTALSQLVDAGGNDVGGWIIALCQGGEVMMGIGAFLIGIWAGLCLLP